MLNQLTQPKRSTHFKFGMKLLLQRWIVVPDNTLFSMTISKLPRQYFALHDTSLTSITVFWFLFWNRGQIIGVLGSVKGSIADIMYQQCFESASTIIAVRFIDLFSELFWFEDDKFESLGVGGDARRRKFAQWSVLWSSPRESWRLVHKTQVSPLLSP